MCRVTYPTHSKIGSKPLLVDSGFGCWWSELVSTLQCITLLYIPGAYSVWCQKIVQDDSPLERQVVYYVWMYYMIKLVDLIDTVRLQNCKYLKSPIHETRRIRVTM